MKIILVSKCSLDIGQYVEFKMTVLICPSKSLISSRWVTYVNILENTSETIVHMFKHKHPPCSHIHILGFMTLSVLPLVAFDASLVVSLVHFL